MATLEVHDGRGRVERVTITRDNPILFGSNPKCDIALSGEGVLPFHGRMRWKGSRYKVDASPMAEYLEINGQRMTTASFHQGDEIQIGPNRIFMINPEDDLPNEDKTRIQPAPRVERNEPRAPRAKNEPNRAQAPPAAARKGRLDREDWLGDLEAPPPSAEVAVAEAEPPVAGRGRVEVKPAKPERHGNRLASLFSLRQQAPGEERILSSPLVITLVTCLAVLVLMGYGLHHVIRETIATRTFNRAMESYDDGDYRNAIRRFEEFLAQRSDEKRSSQARVLKALANVRQFTATTGASWTHALEAERSMFQTVRLEEAYRDSSTELDDLILRTGEALADRARLTADARVLAEVEAALKLHKDVTGEAAAGLLAKTRLPSKLTQAREAVRKEQIRVRALAAMDAALKAGSSAGVYAARDGLVRQYADLSEDRDLIERMTKANELIRRAVTFDTSRRLAETEPHPEPLGPPVSLVLRSALTEKTADGPVVHALADGFAFGIDAATGAPLWQVAVGLSSPFPPQSIPGSTTALAFDARHDELVRLNSRTGALAWRQALGEPIRHPPLVLGNQIIQATPGGKVLLIDLATGELEGTFDLGLPLTRTAVSDETGRFLFVLAEKDCLFILGRDPMTCAAVEYLGHAAGSIPCPPARLGRFLVVAENHTLADSRWRVFVIASEGNRVNPVQQVPVAGWTWGTPAASGAVIWAIGDVGGAVAYAIGSYEEKEPLKPLARINSEKASSGPAFPLAKTAREIWVASGRSARFDLDTDRGKIETVWTLGEAGPALAPIQLAGSLLVLTQQATEGHEGVALWGVDTQSGQVRWRTILGAGWPVSLEPAAAGEGLTSLDPEGRTLSISSETLASGGFVTVALPGPGVFQLPAGRLERLEDGSLTVLVPARGTRQLLVREGIGPFRKVDLPAPLGATPLLWGRDLLVPGDDGRAYLIDPLTGESRAEPFVPSFDRTRAMRWRAPVKLDDDAVALVEESGRVRRMTRQSEPRPRLVAAAEILLDKEIVADPASTGPALLLATADGRLRALASRDLGPIGAWPLEAPLAVGPTTVGGRVFVADREGGMLAISRDGQRLWSISLGDSPAAGPPIVRDEAAWFLTADGSLQARALADGASIERLALGILPIEGLIQERSRTVVPVGFGTVRAMVPSK